MTKSLMWIPEQLFEISNVISQQFSPRFSNNQSTENYKFSANDLLAISETISRQFSPKYSLNSPQLLLLPVDHSHFYAYWDVISRLTSTKEKQQQTPMMLRVYNQETNPSSTCLDFLIHSAQGQQKISLPEASNSQSYSAAIGYYPVQDEFIIVTQSNAIHIPRIPACWQSASIEHSPPNKQASGLGVTGCLI